MKPSSSLQQEWNQKWYAVRMELQVIYSYSYSETVSSYSYMRNRQ